MVSVKQEFQLIETRLISGKGLFKLNYNSDYRAFRLFSQVVRLPVTNYENVKWNPSRSEYCKIVWTNDDYVLRENVLNYKLQRLDWIVDDNGDSSFWSLCTHEIIIKYFDYLAPYVGATPLVSTADKIWFTPLSYYFDKILISCREDTAISFSLYGLKFNINCPEAIAGTAPKPVSPSKISPLPPGFPIGDISPAYDGATDNGNTKPASIDIPTPPDTSGNPCQGYTLRFRYRVVGSTSTNTQAVVILGKYGGSGTLRLKTGDASIVQLYCQGTPFPGCQTNLGYYDVYSVGSPVDPSSLQFISIS